MITMSDEVIQRASIATDAVWEQLDEIIKDEAERHDTEVAAVVYLLLMTITRVLAEYGWKPDQLAQEVTYHATAQTTAGEA